MRALLGPACLAILPLAVWPGLDRPFSTPKLAWLVASVMALLMRPGAGRVSAVAPAVRWTTLAWVASFVVAGLATPLPSFPTLALGIAAPLFGWALVREGAPPATLLASQVLGATICAGVALAQWAGLDPFVLAGWHPPIDGASIRMRVYGTLGNPNFVGVLMATSLPLTLATLGGATTRVGQRLAVLALAVQAAALVATGSRGAVLGLGAAVAVYAFLRWSRRVRVPSPPSWSLRASRSACHPPARSTRRPPAACTSGASSPRTRGMRPWRGWAPGPSPCDSRSGSAWRPGMVSATDDSRG